MKRLLLAAFVLVLATSTADAQTQEFSPEYTAQLKKTAEKQKVRTEAKKQAAARAKQKRALEAQVRMKAQAEQQAILQMQVAQKLQAQREARANSPSSTPATKPKPSKYYGTGPNGYHNGLNGPGTYYSPGGSNSRSGYFSGGKHYEYGTGPNLEIGRVPEK